MFTIFYPSMIWSLLLFTPLLMGMEHTEKHRPKDEKESETGREHKKRRTGQPEQERPEWSQGAQEELFHAIVSDHVIKQFKEEARELQQDCTRDFPDVFDKSLALTQVDLPRVQKALENAADPNSWRRSCFNLIVSDWECGKEYAIEYLTEKGLYLNDPLALAATIGHIELGKLLLKYGADASHSWIDVTPLFIAAYHSNLEFAKLLMIHGANLADVGVAEIVRPNNRIAQTNLLDALVNHGYKFDQATINKMARRIDNELQSGQDKFDRPFETNEMNDALLNMLSWLLSYGVQSDQLLTIARKYGFSKLLYHIINHMNIGSEIINASLLSIDEALHCAAVYANLPILQHIIDEKISYTIRSKFSNELIIFKNKVSLLPY